MYCKNCNKLLKNNEKICSECGFNNDITDNKLIEKKKYKKEKDNSKGAITIIVFLLVITASFAFIYTVRDMKKQDEAGINGTLTTTEEVKLKKFKYDNLILEYPPSFGVSSSVIFLKENSNINIELSKVSLDEYNSLIELNDTLDNKVGEFSSKTFADENAYFNLIALNDKYYVIKVNYISDTNVYTESVQLQISKILNTLKKK